MTDHSEEIDTLRFEAKEVRDRRSYPALRWAQSKADEVADQMDLAAELLELHDTTGISLDNWPTARRIVERAIGAAIMENHV